MIKWLGSYHEPSRSDMTITIDNVHDILKASQACRLYFKSMFSLTELFAFHDDASRFRAPQSSSGQKTQEKTRRVFNICLNPAV